VLICSFDDIIDMCKWIAS